MVTLILFVHEVKPVSEEPFVLLKKHAFAILWRIPIYGKAQNWVYILYTVTICNHQSVAEKEQLCIDKESEVQVLVNRFCIWYVLFQEHFLWVDRK